MHPEVRQKTPGNCPICGMALEAENISPEEGFDSELSFLKNRFIVPMFHPSAALRSPVEVGGQFRATFQKLPAIVLKCKKL
jgi:Cu+-exporting ATPase